MEFAQKDFSHYWKIIRIPTFVLVGWSVLGFIIAIISFSLYASIFSSSASWLLMIIVFAFIGWTTIKDHKETVKIAAYAGALCGVITGFIGAVIGILMFYFIPAFIQYAIAQAATQPGVDAAAIQGFMQIGMYIGLITGPLFSALIGAAISAVAALIAKKV